jgi:sulfur-oxidizing protein SoxX
MHCREITAFALLAAAIAASTAVVAQKKSDVAPARAEAALKAGFAGAPADWLDRVGQDTTMRECSTHRNSPPADVARAIQARESARIEYPADGKLTGDWKKGEALAQSGYGLRFTDYPPQRANGGNCYACHQLDPKEVSYGTMGPTLKEYGKIRKFAAAEVKAVYDKIFNPHAAFPCSLMPRFGSSRILTLDQIKDIVALLMDPESPVNK